MAVTTTAIDWAGWLERWDRQQEGFLPDREERFSVMLDACELVAGTSFRALDLASGPGSISQRLLQRFPEARACAIDIDPVCLSIGRGALGDLGGRLQWFEGNLIAGEWTSLLPQEPFDAVLSTTAIHWLTTEQIEQLYGQLAGILRPGGVFLNGDHMQFDSGESVAGRYASARRDRIAAKSAVSAVEGWDQWWAEIAKEPGMPELLAERERRFGPRPTVPTTLKQHIAALRGAGFSEVEVIWQKGDNRVLMGVL